MVIYGPPRIARQNLLVKQKGLWQFAERVNILANAMINRQPSMDAELKAKVDTIVSVFLSAYAEKE